MAGSIVLTSTTVIAKSNPPARIASAKELLVSWVGDSGNGTVPTLLIDSLMGWYLTKVITNPGDGVAPTTLYDITFVDADGVDVMDSSLLNRSATVSEKVLSAELVGAGGFTITIAGQAVHNATGTIRIFAVR